MIRQLVWDARRRLLRRQAAVWVLRIAADRGRYEAGLRRWIGRSAERAAIYNSANRTYHQAGTDVRRVYSPRSRLRANSDGIKRRPTSLNLVLVMAVSLIVAATGAKLVLVFLGRSQAVQVASTGVGKDYTTRIGEVRTVHLPDGSQVVLDTNSLIRVAFTKAKRGVVLEHGRARFEVAHNTGWPFVVRAGGGTITARGTVFDVEAYQLIRVRLITGAIDVAYPQAPGKSAPPVRLSAGQQLRFDPAMTAPPEAPTQTPASDTQWVSGMKTFDDVPVSDILDEVNRYSSTKIELSDPSLGTHRVFLDLDVRNIADVAQNLALYLQLDIDRSRPGYLILRSNNVLN